LALKDLTVGYGYDTSKSDVDVVSEFLEPCLQNSITYDRLSGYFSSKFLALAAKGLGSFISSEGKMRLVMSAQLSPSDFSRLTANVATGEDYASLFENRMSDASQLADEMYKHHFEAMCWLLANDRLEIRLSIYQGEEAHAVDPIFHPKLGIFTDINGDKISFSGSVNETAKGWTGNVEEFKVFRSWEPQSAGYFNQDADSFERHWNGAKDSDFITVPLPVALREKLISVAPEDMPNLPRKKSDAQSKPKTIVKLRNYQLDAIKHWVDAGKIGILAMATGTGKTKTAKGCIENVMKDGSSVIVITAPYEHIALQWVEELRDYDPILASSSNNWVPRVKQAASHKAMSWIKHCVVVAVQKTAAGDKFEGLMSDLVPLFDNSLFVGDEVHGLGATSYQRALNPIFASRLGLSATPERYFDEPGTKAVSDYFSKIVYEFDTKTALAWRDPETKQRALCDYKYYPEFVELSAEELKEYGELTEKIGAAIGMLGDGGTSKSLEMLLFARAAIVKKAASKIPALESIISGGNVNISSALIYCHDFEQLMQVAEILNKKGITYQKITGDESTSPSAEFQGHSQREWILKQFADGNTRVLLAIKCLDEGVDIPGARMAFILASSGNPREFIQRRGRLLRPSESKPYAEIFDFIVAPSFSSDKLNEQEKKVFSKELERIRDLSEDALNADNVKILMGEVLLKVSGNG
jgi:superfamily II DNA or RNA helicase